MRKIYLLLVVLLQTVGSRANFQEGSFVPTSRRGQFHGSRTNWHDLLGRHCPKFGEESEVAIPIPQPQGFKAVHNSYKIQLMFDGDRLLTPWLKLIGHKTPAAPMLRVELERSGDALTAVTAEVQSLPSQYLREHQVLVREYQNATHWPKHLIVHYRWRHANPINATGGLYLIFASGIFVTIILAISTLASYQDKLQAFLTELAAEDFPPGQHRANGQVLDTHGSVPPIAKAD